MNITNRTTEQHIEPATVQKSRDSVKLTSITQQ